MTDDEPFTLISGSGLFSKSTDRLSSHYERLTSANIADVDIQLVLVLRERHPQLTITIIPDVNVPLLTFAAAGFATASLDLDNETVFRWRGFNPPIRRGETGQLGDVTLFACYHYQWENEDFLLYTVSLGGRKMQYILREPGPGENPLSHCALTDKLLLTAGKEIIGDETSFVYVFNSYWTRDRVMWEEVQKSSWDNVILDSVLKKELQDAAGKFFDSKAVYEKYNVPWKRGLIFHGPPGNGKTISLKALMKTLYDRAEPIPTLYVKSAYGVSSIGMIFSKARDMAPCLLVMEDIETIVSDNTRSFFFNEMDGLANNDGIFIIASTNYLDRLDPGLSQRPSRFDRKYLFPLPQTVQAMQYSSNDIRILLTVSQHERTLYAAYWQRKLRSVNPSLEFPDPLCPAIAGITSGFSFAYMQEAFLTTLLVLAKDETSSGDGDSGSDTRESDRADGRNEDVDDDKLNQYKLWRIIKVEVAELRKQMKTADGTTSNNNSNISLNISGNIARCGQDSTSQSPATELTEREKVQTSSSDKHVPLWSSSDVEHLKIASARTGIEHLSANRGIANGHSLRPSQQTSLAPHRGKRKHCDIVDSGDSFAPISYPGEGWPAPAGQGATEYQLMRLGVNKGDYLTGTAFEWRL